MDEIDTIKKTLNNLQNRLDSYYSKVESLKNELDSIYNNIDYIDSVALEDITNNIDNLYSKSHINGEEYEDLMYKVKDLNTEIRDILNI